MIRSKGKRLIYDSQNKTGIKKVEVVYYHQGKQFIRLSTPPWFSEVCRVDKEPRENGTKLVQCLQDILQHPSSKTLSRWFQNIARVRNCPDVTKINSLFGLWVLSYLFVCLFILSSFGLFAFLSFCLFIFLSCCLFVMLSFCHVVFLSFCLFVFLSFCLDIMLIKCLKGLKSKKSLFVSKF